MMKIEIPEKALRIISLLEDAGFEAYVVGGCVRDAILGREPNDWDITTSAKPDQAKAVMHAAGIETVDTGIKHGTVTILMDHEPFETTTFRSDGSYSDGRHPDSVQFLEHIDGDLSRRDFTVNAMAYSPTRGLVDRFGGREDLAAGILRSVGMAHERFDEDALRIMRAIRFAATFDFAIAADTAAAIHADRELLRRVSVERIASELGKLACAPHMLRIMLEYADVLTVFMPQIEPSIGFDQRNFHHCYTVWEHCVRACSHAPQDDLALRYAALFHDIGKPACYALGEDGQGHFYRHREVSADLFRAIAKVLKLPCRLSEDVETLVRYHDANLPTTAKGMRHWAVKFGPETVRRLFMIHRFDVMALAPDEVEPALANLDCAEALFEESIAEVSATSVKDLAVNGRDLMEAGIEQGPQLGMVLAALLEAVVDGEVENERESLIARALDCVEAG